MAQAADHTIRAEWTPRRDGENYFVEEQITVESVRSTGLVQHGPMRADQVQPFIEERKAYIADVVGYLTKQYLAGHSGRVALRRGLLR